MTASRHNGNIFYFGDVDDAMEDLVVPLTKEITRQNKLRDGHIDLWVNSFGGYLHVLQHLVTLVELAKESGTIVRTMVPATAFSAGSMLAVAGSPGERYVDRYAEHLIHHGIVQSLETTPLQITRLTGFKNRQFKTQMEHYNKYCSIPDLEAQIMDDGFFVPASKAIKWNMADKYFNKLTL